MFIERDVRGIWPGSPSWVKSAEPPTQSTGWQIDLEYDPLWYGMHLNKSNILEPFVTRYIAVTYGDASVGGTNGIYHFLTTEDEFRNITWTKTALITSNLINPSINISHLQPIRMISVNDVNPGQLTYGQFVHFSGSYESDQGIWEIRNDGSLLAVEKMTQPPFAHDFKALGDDGLTSGGVSSSAYLHEPIPYDVKMEESFGLDWEENLIDVNSLYTAKTFADSSFPRSLAMDYFGEDTVGILWVAEEVVNEVSEDLLVFKETAGSEERVSTHYYDGTVYAGCCDFDYEPVTGIGCAVYELRNGTNRTIKLKFRNPLTKLWIELPSAIADYTSTTRSNVDMVLDNGYIYIAYSAPIVENGYSAIQMVIVDLLNRP